LLKKEGWKHCPGRILASSFGTCGSFT
jgi:hypothetical protein